MVDEAQFYSDFAGARRFALAIGPSLPLRGKESGAWDQLVLDRLKAISPASRWVLEIRTGLWTGEGFRRDWRAISHLAQSDKRGVQKQFAAAVIEFRAALKSLHG